MTLSVGAWSSAPKALRPNGLGSRARHSWKLFVLNDVPLDSWVSCDPGYVYARMSHLATLGCPRRQSAVLGGPLLGGPLVSDEAARSLATMGPGPVRLPSGSGSSSRILGMTKLAKRDSLLVCRFEGGDVLGQNVSMSVPKASLRVWAGTTGDGDEIASSSSMGWSYVVSLSAEMMASSYPLSACCA